MLWLYNCTRIYIVKYRQSIAFRIIYIIGHFPVACAGESHKDLRKSRKSPVAVILNITMCSLDVNISVVCTTASDKGQERC